MRFIRCLTWLAITHQFLQRTFSVAPTALLILSLVSPFRNSELWPHMQTQSRLWFLTTQLQHSTSESLTSRPLQHLPASNHQQSGAPQQVHLLDCLEIVPNLPHQVWLAISLLRHNHIHSVFPLPSCTCPFRFLHSKCTSAGSITLLNSLRAPLAPAQSSLKY